MKRDFVLGSAMLCLMTSLARAQDGSAPASTKAEQQAKAFVTLLTQQEFQNAAAGFDATMTTALPAEKLRTTWLSLLQGVGAFQAIESSRVAPYQKYQIALVTCRFERQRIDVKVVIDEAGKIAGLFFVPTQPEQAAQFRTPVYADKTKYREMDVTLGAGEWALPGTLTLPVGPGPFPAVVLVHGSGPEDRDETVGANKPFRDLAWGLASHGVAALRYEKRTKQYAVKLASHLDGFTVREETVADALEAVALLRKTQGIDAGKVFVLGHSLGGMLVPRIGEGGSGIAGFIVMAGAARPLEDLILEQTAYQLSLAGEPTEATKSKLEEVKRLVATIKGLSKENSFQGSIFGAPASYWLDLKGYQPASAAMALKQPMLILQGESDCQASMKDFDAWRQALASRKDVALKSYPSLNHLFIETTGKSTGAEYQQPGNVAANVIDDVAGWINRH